MYLISNNINHIQIIIPTKNIFSFDIILSGTIQKSDLYIIGQENHNKMIKNNSNKNWFNFFII